MKLKEFKNMWNSLAKTEDGTIKYYLIGVLEYIDNNKDAEEMNIFYIKDIFNNLK